MTPEQKAFRYGMQLIFAAQDGATEEAKTYVGKGADINFSDPEGRTILHWAAAGKHDALLNWVIEHPKFHKLTDTDAQNKTALDLLRERDTTPMCKLMCDKIIHFGKNYTAKNSQQSTTKSTTDDTFLKATWAEKYDYKYKKEDINGIMEFFCNPLDERDASAMLKREFPLIELGEILSLFINCENGAMFFEVNEQSSKQDTLKDTSQHDPTTEALLKVRDECYLISNFKFQTNRGAENKKKLTEKLEKLDKGLCPTSPSKRMFFAAALGEKQRTLQKAERCIKYLKDIQNNKTELTYKEALTLVLCIETLAAQDTYSPKKLEKKEEDTLKQLKKNYCERHFPSDIKVTIFKELRGEFVHSSSTLTLHDINEVELDWNQLWSRLGVFMNEFHQKLSGTREENTEGNDLEELLKKLLSDLKKRKGEKTNIFVNYCENTAKFLSLTSDQSGYDDILHKLLFDVLTIMGPAYKCDPSKPVELSSLRNQIIHDFINESKEGLREKIPRTIRIMYRYLLARDMNNILTKERGEEEFGQLEQELSSVLETMNKQLVNFSFPQKYDRSCVASFFTDDASLRRTVNTYLMCLAPLRDCMDHDDDDLMSTHRVPKSEEVSVLFEKLLQLGNMHADESELSKELQRVFTLDESQANSVLSAKNEVDASNDDILEEIYKGLKSIGQQHVNWHISVSDLAQCVTSKKDHKSPLQNGLTEKMKLEIQNLFDSLPAAEMWKYVHLNGCKVPVSILSVISSILTLVSNANELMHLRIENVALAFQDEYFVRYLVKHQMPTAKQTQTLNNFFWAKDICKHLQGLKYTGPYTAALIYTSNNCKIISTLGMEDLMKTLILHNDYKPLGNLLKTEDSKLYKSFWKTVLIGDFSEETIEQCYYAAVNEKCHELFKKFADSIIDLKVHPLYSQNVQKLSNSLNNIIARLINSYNVNDADKLMSCVIDSSPEEKIIRRRLQAKLLNRRAAEELKGSKETLKGHYKYGIPLWIMKKENPTERDISEAAKSAAEIKGGSVDQIKEEIKKRHPKYRDCRDRIVKMYRDSQVISSNLKETITDCSTSMKVLRLLVLSDYAYSEMQINQLFNRDYELGHEAQTKLRNEWFKYLDLKADLPPRELLRRLAESTKYKAIQNDKECYRYLNFGKVENGWVKAGILAAPYIQGNDLQNYVDRLDEVAAADNHPFSKATALSMKCGIYYKLVRIDDNNNYFNAKLVETLIRHLDEVKQRFGPYHDKVRRTLESLNTVYEGIEKKKRKW